LPFAMGQVHRQLVDMLALCGMLFES